MVEIIPNWHPIFVHFTVALISTSVGFYLLAYLGRLFNLRFIQTTLLDELETVARWCLWFAALITFGTVSAGFYAYGTVQHDATSYLAMTDHMNWALSTFIALTGVTLWSFWRYRTQKAVTLLFLCALFIVESLLISTAWRGGELVFRQGIGVLSLPKQLEQNVHK